MLETSPPDTQETTMRRALLTLGVFLATGGLAAAQYPPPGVGGGYGPINPNNLMPNIYNPQTQPLSPYLNLLRGGNLATDYYYGVRPGTVGMAPRGFGGAPFVAGGGNRPLFFPQFTGGPDPLSAGGDYVLPPAGHPVVFGNTMGFFPSPLGQAGGARPGLAGLGSGRTAPRK
jgi:hypothetical protein